MESITSTPEPDGPPNPPTGDNTYRTRTVYDRCMSRTNIVINDELIELVMRRYGVHTKTEAVDLALRHLAGRPMTTAEALDMRGARAILDIPPERAPS